MNMFCPKCGKSDQQKNTFCRNCGTFLPDFENLKKKETAPEVHLKANSVLSLMTAIVSLTRAIMLYVMFLGKDDTPPIIYVVAGFLTAITAWQVQTFWRNMLLKKHFKKRKTSAEENVADQKVVNFPAAKTKELLNEADFSNFVPTSVVENTTKNLQKTPRS